MSKNTTRSPAIQVVSNVVSNKGQKRIEAREKHLHCCTVITALMNLMNQKSLLSSERRVSSKEQEDMKSDTNKLSKSLRQLVARGHHHKTMDQVKALLAKLDVGMFMPSTSFNCCYIISSCYLNLVFVKIDLC